MLGLAYWESDLKNRETLALKTMEKGLNLCKKYPGEFDCVIIVQNLASKYLVCENCLGEEKNMFKVIEYANEGLRLVDKNSNLQDYTRFYYLLGEAYGALAGKENLLKSRNAYKEVLKYSSSPWFESARERLWYVDQELRFLENK